MQNLLEKIIIWAVALVAKFGYGGIFLTMALESALLPVPSEVVLPFAGFLSSSGQLNFWLVVLIASLANLAGSVALYLVGIYGGRVLLKKYGHYFFIHEAEITKVERWMRHYQGKVAFFSRLLPGVRGFSSLIIGAGGVGFKKFFWYTLFGSLIWNFWLAYAGYVAGNHWDWLGPYFRKFEWLIGAVIFIGVILFFIKHRRQSRAH